MKTTDQVQNFTMDQEKVVKNLISDIINPTLSMHGGSVKFVSLEDNKLTIQFKGNCAGCPGRTRGTLNLIKEVMQDEGFNFVITSI